MANEATPIRPGTTKTFLDPEDLSQFRVRRAAIEQAAMASSMMQAGYGVWADDLRSRYNLDGPFDVVWETGEILTRPTPEPETPKSETPKPERKRSRRKSSDG